MYYAFWAKTFQSENTLMRPNLQQVINNLTQLTLEEKWQLMNHLMRQLQNSMNATEVATASSVKEQQDIAKLLAETRGSWGHQSLDEIDAMIDENRALDWKE